MTWSIRPYSLASSADMKRSRSMSFSIDSTVLPVCLAYSSLSLRRRNRISRAWISMSDAVPWVPPEGWCIMMHQPSGGTQGTASDIEIQAREILYLRSKLNELYAKHTGKAVETIEKDMDRDRFLSADEAKEYGLIDHVIAHYKEMDDGKKK